MTRGKRGIDRILPLSQPSFNNRTTQKITECCRTWREVRWGETQSEGESGHPEPSCAGSQGSQTLACSRSSPKAWPSRVEGAIKIWRQCQRKSCLRCGAGVRRNVESREEVEWIRMKSNSECQPLGKRNLAKYCPQAAGRRGLSVPAEPSLSVEVAIKGQGIQPHRAFLRKCSSCLH